MIIERDKPVSLFKLTSVTVSGVARFSPKVRIIIIIIIIII